MRKNSRWAYAIFFLAVLFFAVGNSNTIYAKSNSTKTAYISSKEVSLAKGQSITLSVKNNRKKVKWVSSDKKVASVNGKGKIKALKKGTAVITAAVGKKKYKCNVTISDKKANVLIAYFSTTGTTKSAAKKIQKETNGTLICLQPQKAYTENYSKLLDMAMGEQESNKRPTLATTIKNMKQYDTIILGYPIWHGKEPMIVRTFLEKYNVSGKKIIPFCTSGGSGISGSMAGIRKYAKGADVMQGKDLSGLSQTSVRQWLKKAGVL